eukprot:scaffold129781_cov33-Tisochrysis_lutea.AAC.2
MAQGSRDAVARENGPCLQDLLTSPVSLLSSVNCGPAGLVLLFLPFPIQAVARDGYCASRSDGLPSPSNVPTCHIVVRLLESFQRAMQARESMCNCSGIA